MFLGRVGQFLGLQLLHGADNAETRVARFYNIIDIAITWLHCKDWQTVWYIQLLFQP